MNKKVGIIAGAVVIIVILLLLVSGSDIINNESNNSTTPASGNDNTTLVVGFDANFPPYGYKDDNGEYVGFDLDLAQEVCNRNNWTLVKQPIDWNTKDSELSSGAVDCLWNGFTINGREDQYTWSRPYVNNKQVIVVKKNSNITNFAQLRDKYVETQEDSSSLRALEDDEELTNTFAELIQVSDYNTAFMDLDCGACDAVAMDGGTAQYQISSKKNSADYMILNEEISSEQYGVGFKKGNTQLRDQVQQTLDEMEADGTVDKIAAKYSDYGVPGSLCLNESNQTNNQTGEQ